MLNCFFCKSNSWQKNSPRAVEYKDIASGWEILEPQSLQAWRNDLEKCLYMLTLFFRWPDRELDGSLIWLGKSIIVVLKFRKSSCPSASLSKTHMKEDQLGTFWKIFLLFNMHILLLAGLTIWVHATVKTGSFSTPSLKREFNKNVKFARSQNSWQRDWYAKRSKILCLFF